MTPNKGLKTLSDAAQHHGSLQGKRQVVESPSEFFIALQTGVIAIVRALVSQPEQVRVEFTTEEGSLRFRIATASGDLGRLIGKQGRTARALRILMQAAGKQLNRSILVDIDAPKKLMN